MLIHGALQEQLIRDRQKELVELADPPPGAMEPFFVGMVRALLPALTHGVLRIPAPPRPVGSGC